MKDYDIPVSDVYSPWNLKQHYPPGGSSQTGNPQIKKRRRDKELDPPPHLHRRIDITIGVLDITQITLRGELLS